MKGSYPWRGANALGSLALMKLAQGTYDEGKKNGQERASRNYVR